MLLWNFSYVYLSGSVWVKSVSRNLQNFVKFWMTVKLRAEFQSQFKWWKIACFYNFIYFIKLNNLCFGAWVQVQYSCSAILYSFNDVQYALYGDVILNNLVIDSDVWHLMVKIELFLHSESQVQQEAYHAGRGSTVLLLM